MKAEEEKAHYSKVVKCDHFYIAVLLISPPI